MGDIIADKDGVYGFKHCLDEFVIKRFPPHSMSDFQVIHFFHICICGKLYAKRETTACLGEFAGIRPWRHWLP